jgi:hypothetical protein
MLPGSITGSPDCIPVMGKVGILAGLMGCFGVMLQSMTGMVQA